MDSTDNLLQPDLEGVPEQTDNTPRPEDGAQLPPEANGDEWTGEGMR